MHRHHRATLVIAFLVVSVPLALSACNGATANTSNSGSAIPLVAGTWRGYIDIQDTSGYYSDWSGTIYLRVEQTAGGDLTGEAKLCDMSVFGDKGPEYSPLTGTADRSNRVSLDINAGFIYRLEGPFDPERLRLTGIMTQTYAGDNPKTAPATGDFTPVGASEYATACPRHPTPTPATPTNG
jgi:hypothetical protein